MNYHYTSIFHFILSWFNFFGNSSRYKKKACGNNMIVTTAAKTLEISLDILNLAFIIYLVYYY